MHPQVKGTSSQTLSFTVLRTKDTSKLRALSLSVNLSINQSHSVPSTSQVLLS